MTRFPRTLYTLILLAGLSVPVVAQGVGGGLEVVEAAASMEDKLGAVLPRELEFTDERGYPLKLGQFFPGDKPVLLQLGYYGCPGMCGAVMSSMVEALNEVDLQPGEDYLILSVSIDPREKPELAGQNKANYLQSFDKVGAQKGWYFTVGEQESISQLTDVVGFRYYWMEDENRFNHPPALLFVSPQGKLTRVISDIAFDPDDVRLALVEASDGRVGTFWDRIRLSCLTFDPREGTYSVQAITVMQIGGAITLGALIVMVLVLIRRERRKSDSTIPDEAASSSTPDPIPESSS